MKNITLAADESLIEGELACARIEPTTLNEQFPCWLAEYAHNREGTQRYDAVMAKLRGQLRVGRKLSRDEKNERQSSIDIGVLIDHFVATDALGIQTCGMASTLRP